MDLGAIVDVAIGIIFVWIVLSLTTIQIQEWISTAFDKRAKDMEASIHEMLANSNLKAQFYDHPIIRGLTAKKRRWPSKIPTWFYTAPILRGFTKEKRKLPSYIPAQQFALTLFDVAMTANTESSIIQQGILGIRNELQNDRKLTVQQAVIEELNLLADFARSAAATEAGTAITLRTKEMLKDKAEHFIEDFYKNHKGVTLDDKVVGRIVKALDEAVKQAPTLKAKMDQVVALQPVMETRKPAADAQTQSTGSDAAKGIVSEDTLNKVRKGVAALSVISPELNQTLNTLLMNVEEYVTEKEKVIGKARSNVEKWFDDAMDRVSGNYKRYSQNLALAIGFFIALIMNVDSISFTLYLWQDPTVRDALAAKAASFELPKDQLKENPQQAMQNFRSQFAGLSLPVGWTLKDRNDPIFSVPGSLSGTGCKASPKGVGYFGIPLFRYRLTNIGPFENMCLTSLQPERSTNIWVKLLGIVITAVAARQGAPFWFDILKKIVNLRGTGANPIEKAK